MKRTFKIIKTTGETVTGTAEDLSELTGLTVQQIYRVSKEDNHKNYTTHLLKEADIDKIELYGKTPSVQKVKEHKKMPLEEALKYYQDAYPEDEFKINYKYSVIVSKRGLYGGLIKGKPLYRGTVMNNGYLSFRITSMQRLIWTTFNGEIPNGLEVMHIDSNKENNNLSNLKLGTHRENLAQRNEENPEYFTHIMEYDLEGNFIKEWNGVGDYAAAHNITWNPVYLALTGRSKTCCGSIILYKGTSDDRLKEYIESIKNGTYLRIENRGNRNLNRDGIRKAVISYDLDGNKVKEYNSVSEAAKDLKTSSSNIIGNIKGKSHTVRGLVFKYKGE